MDKKKEQDRLDTLLDLEILDTQPEESLDNIVELASYICGCPISLVSLVDDCRQWFKARTGLDAQETPRELAFCNHAIEGDEIFIVENSLEDDRFKDNPLVIDDPRVIFYAGIPLKINNRHNIGTLCVIDNKARKLSEEQIKQLKLLSKQAVSYIEMRQKKKTLEKISHMMTRLHYLNIKEELDLDNVIEAYIKAGTELFEMEFGIESRIDGDNYIVENAVSPNGELEKGAVFELSGTYCSAVVEARKTVTYHEVGAIPEMRGHPVYVNMKLESYISTPIWLDGEIYGTLNFSSLKIRKSHFNKDEEKFVEILADLVSKRIQFNRQQLELKYAYDIMNETPLYIGVADAKTGKSLYNNKAFAEVSGKPKSDFEVSKYHPKWAADLIQNVGIPESAKHDKWVGESALLDRDDNEVPILQTIVAHRDKSGTPVYFSTIMQDYSKQKDIERNLTIAKEQAVDASRMKSEFLANVSHEIRTPMNGIMGMVSLLKDSELDESQADMLRIINNCGEGLLVLLNDVLDLSKIEQNKLEIEEIDFSVRQITDEVVSLYYFKSKESSTILNMEVDEDVKDLLVGDPTRIKQILINFVSNALKFTPNGTVSVKVSTLLDSTSSCRLRFSVVDTGLGIPKSNQEKIFEAFTQEDASVTRKFGGTGLGLSICSKLAHLMHGEIGLESEEKKGSTFYVDLPLKKSLKEALEIDTGSFDFDKNFSKNYPHSIIVVEDNPINQKLAKAFLAKLGYTIDFANDGLEALEMIPQGNYSLAFMDMQMPRMDGVTSTEKIRNEMGSNAPLFVAMTANVFKEDKLRCLKVGMVEFIAKPFKIEDFVRAIIAIS
jgi:signal transduction histidine kinase/GAF domain-containing protein